MMRHSAAAEFPRLQELGTEWGVATILAASQIMDQAIARMRQSLQRRTLVELALVRISHLGRLDDLATLVAQLKSGNVPLPVARPPLRRSESAPALPMDANVRIEESKKKIDDIARTGVDGPTTASGTTSNPDADQAATIPTTPSADEAGSQQIGDAPAPAMHSTPAAQLNDALDGSATATVVAAGVALTEHNAKQIWEQSLSKVDGLTGDAAREYESIRLDGDHHLTVTLRSQYHANRCRRPDHKDVIEAALTSIVGRSVKFSVEVQERERAVRRSVSRRSQAELIRESYDHPFVRQAMDLFGADVVSVQEKRNSK